MYPVYGHFWLHKTKCEHEAWLEASMWLDLLYMQPTVSALLCVSSWVSEYKKYHSMAFFISSVLHRTFACLWTAGWRWSWSKVKVAFTSRDANLTTLKCCYKSVQTDSIDFLIFWSLHESTTTGDDCSHVLAWPRTAAVSSGDAVVLHWQPVAVNLDGFLIWS